MHYLVASPDIAGSLVPGCRLLAEGETMSFEEPWTFGGPILVRIEDDAALAALQANIGLGVGGAFAVVGLEEPGPGTGFGIGAHLMRDPESFKPYAAAVPDVVARFGGRFLARGGSVTPVAGSFVPDRVVVIEFPDPAAGAEFYFSAAYAPLLKIRLAATDPRFALAVRSGEMPEAVRSHIARRA